MSRFGGKYDGDNSDNEDKGDIGFIDFDDYKSHTYNPSLESKFVQISVPFEVINGKARSGVVGETICDSVTIKNISGEPMDLWSVSIYDAKPDNSFTISVMKPPDANSDQEYRKHFLELFSLEDRILRTDQPFMIWLSCKPKEIGLHTAAVHISVGNETIERVVFVLAEDKISQAILSDKPYQRYRRKNQEVMNRHAPDATICVGRRPHRNSNRGFTIRIPEYPIPQSIREMLNNQQIPDAVVEGLTPRNYGSFFKDLLAMEEIKLEEDMRAYDMESVTLRSKRCAFLSLEVPGLAEKRPSLLIGDYIFAKSATDYENQNVSYQGYIHRVEAEEIYLKFDPKFHRHYQPRNLYNVCFSYNRTGHRKLYQAIEAAEGLNRGFLFPSVASNMRHEKTAPLVPISRALNKEQAHAVNMILACKGGSPYVIHGPPGTGKTMTLVEAILQVYNLRKSAILVCAPSNSAADHLLERLVCGTSVEIKKDEICRLNAYTRLLEDVNPELMEFCCIEDSFFKCPSRWELEQYRIIVSTYTSASLLYAEGIKRGHFSHIFLDEAGQASEPETMVPVSQLYTKSTVVVLAGDPMQLGPVVFSKDAETYGLGTSYLQRLFSCRLYSDNNKNFMTKLVNNYRTHAAILRLPSDLFYDGVLIPCKENSSASSWDNILPNKEFPLLFIGVQGCDEREGVNPSWFNRIEVSKVVEMIRVLIDESGLKEEDIGVITPYRQQVSKIRCTLENLGRLNIKVGSVEQFQGQEKEVIIISTVRSTIKHNEFDKLHYLGFLSNPRRFNVAVTRAKSLLVVIGNPHILCKDPNWYELLWYCVDNGSYKGCFLPEREVLASQDSDNSGSEVDNDVQAPNGNWDAGTCSNWEPSEGQNNVAEQSNTAAKYNSRDDEPSYSTEEKGDQLSIEGYTWNWQPTDVPWE